MRRHHNHNPAFWLAFASLWLLTGFFSVTCTSGDNPFEPPNGAPVAGDSAITVVEGVPFLGFLPATDPNADPLVYRIVSFPTRGTVAITNTSTGEYRYTGDSPGADLFTFRVSDDLASSNTGTVAITINPGPVALQEPQ